MPLNKEELEFLKQAKIFPQDVGDVDGLTAIIDSLLADREAIEKAAETLNDLVREDHWGGTFAACPYAQCKICEAVEALDGAIRRKK